MNSAQTWIALYQLKTTDLKKDKIKLKSILTHNIYQIYSTNQIYQSMMDLSAEITK